MRYVEIGIYLMINTFEISMLRLEQCSDGVLLARSSFDFDIEVMHGEVKDGNKANFLSILLPK